jgi:hypothetical protein
MACDWTGIDYQIEVAATHMGNRESVDLLPMRLIPFRQPRHFVTAE